MRVSVTIDPEEVGRSMAADNDFGPAALEAFLAEIRSRPSDFVRDANFQAWRIQSADTLRALAKGLEDSASR